MAEAPFARRVLIEGGLIVVSILLAFAIQAWWDGRMQRNDERLMVERLHTEFAADLQQLHEKRRRHTVIHDAAVRLLDLTGPAPWSSDSSEVARLLVDLASNPTFDPAGGALASLLGSGNLNVISDPDLRSLLAAWPGTVSDLQDQERANQAQGHDRLFPMLESSTSWRWAVSVALADSAGYGGGRFPPDVLPILADRDFEGLLLDRLRLVRALLPKYDAAIAMAEDIARQLEDSHS